GLLTRSLAKQGLDIHVETRVTGAAKEAGRVTVQAQKAGQSVEFKADKVLVAVGRRPTTGGLGLEEAGVKLEDKTGKVLVNDKYAANGQGVFAMGDMVGVP